MKTAASTFSPEELSIKYVCGIDIGSQSCAGCILRSDKSVVVKAMPFANARQGWQLWEEKQIPEFGPKTVAVLRVELGDVQRFARTDEVIAYGGMDIEIKESGLWKGKAKLSKHGSGLLRRMLYLAALRSIHLEGSAFGAYYRRLVERGRKYGSALMAVMRKMLAVAAHLLMHEKEEYDPSKVCTGASVR